MKGWLQTEIEQPFLLKAMTTSQESLFPDERVKADRLCFQVRCPLALYEQLTRSRTPAEEVFQLASQLEGKSWHAASDEMSASLHSPLGFELRLEYR